MGLSARQRSAIVAVSLILAVASGGVIAQQLSNSVPVEGPVAIGAPNGMDITITGSADVDLRNPWVASDQVNLTTSKGSADFTGGSTVRATINADEITGEWTNVSSLDVTTSNLRVDPADKNAIEVNGAATSLSFRDAALDDGQVDFVIDGPDSSTATVDLTGLPDNTAVTAIDTDSGKPVGVAQTDSNGDLSITIHLSTQTVRLVSGDQTDVPSLSNPSPTGGVSTTPTELSVDVSDLDFPEDSVDVTVDLDGSQIHSETIGANQTITTSNFGTLTGGQHTWTVEATDQFGNTISEEYTFNIPATLTIRNETNASEIIDSPINVTVRFFGEEEVFTRETDDGTVNMTGLPVTQDFVVDAEATANYTSRTIYIRSIFEQQNVFLLNTNVSTIETRFTLNDPTGQFGGNSIVFVSKPIELNGTTSFRTVYADEFGVEGVTTILQEDERYRVRIETADGDLVQDMGPYRSDVSETVELRPSGPVIEFEGFVEGWNADAELNNRTLIARYADPQNETDSVTIYIHEFDNSSNQLRPNETYFDLGDVQTQYTLTENESKKQWEVNFIIERDGEQLSDQVVVANKPTLLPTGLDEAWRLIVGIGLLTVFAGAFSILNRGVGALMLGVMGGLLWWSGFLTGATTGAAVVVSLFIAIVFNIYLSR